MTISVIPSSSRAACMAFLGQDGVVLPGEGGLGDRGQAARQGQGPHLLSGVMIRPRRSSTRRTVNAITPTTRDVKYSRKRVCSRTREAGVRSPDRAVGVRQGQERPSIIPSPMSDTRDEDGPATSSSLGLPARSVPGVDGCRWCAAGKTRDLFELEMWLRSFERFFRIKNQPLSESETEQLALRNWSEELRLVGQRHPAGGRSSAPRSSPRSRST